MVSWWQTPTVLFADYNLRPMEGQNYVYLPQGLNYVYLQQGLSYVSILFFRIHPCRCIKLSGHPQTLHIGAQTSLASTHPARRCCKVSGSWPQRELAAGCGTPRRCRLPAVQHRLREINHAKSLQFELLRKLLRVASGFIFLSSLSRSNHTLDCVVG